MVQQILTPRTSLCLRTHTGSRAARRGLTQIWKHLRGIYHLELTSWELLGMLEFLPKGTSQWTSLYLPELIHPDLSRIHLQRRTHR